MCVKKLLKEAFFQGEKMVSLALANALGKETALHPPVESYVWQNIRNLWCEKIDIYVCFSGAGKEICISAKQVLQKRYSLHLYGVMLYNATR